MRITIIALLATAFAAIPISLAQSLSHEDSVSLTTRDTTRGVLESRGTDMSNDINQRDYEDLAARATLETRGRHKHGKKHKKKKHGKHGHGRKRRHRKH